MTTNFVAKNTFVHLLVWRLQSKIRQFVARAMLPLKTLGNHPFLSPPISWCSPAILGVPWLIATSLSCASIFLWPPFLISPCVLSSYKDIGYRAHPNPAWPHVNLITYAKTLFPNKIPFTVTGVTASIYLLGGRDTIQPTTQHIFRFGSGHKSGTAIIWNFKDNTAME